LQYFGTQWYSIAARWPQSRIFVPGCVVNEGEMTAGGVKGPCSVAKESVKTGGGVEIAGCVGTECVSTDSRIVDAGSVA